MHLVLKGSLWNSSSIMKNAKSRDGPKGKEKGRMRQHPALSSRTDCSLGARQGSQSAVNRDFPSAIRITGNKKRRLFVNVRQDSSSPGSCRSTASVSFVSYIRNECIPLTTNDFLSLPDACRQLNLMGVKISLSSLYYKLANGSLDASRIGRQWFIPGESLSSLAETLKAQHQTGRNTTRRAP